MMRLVRYLCVAIGLACLLTASASGQKAPPCPLTDAQTQKSIAAFVPIAAFVTSVPRCFNCHGGVNPYLDGPGLDPEDENAPASVSNHFVPLDRPTNSSTVDSQCMGCHDHMAKRRDGGNSVWMLARSDHSFVDKDAVTLCRQFKSSTHTAEAFLAHVQDDEGGNNFAGTGFNGDRGLDHEQFKEIPVEKPYLTHDAFMKLAEDWIAAMGGKFQGDEGCGCELRHDKWSGQIHYTEQFSGDEGSNDLQDWSHSSVTQITVTVSDGSGTYRGHVEAQHTEHLRHRVAHGGGAVTIEPEFSRESEGLGDGTFPATVEVVVNEDKRTYEIKPNATLSSFGGTPKAIGKTREVSCSLGKCDEPRESDIGIPFLPPMDPLAGTLNDRDRIDDSRTLTQGQLGRAKNGTRIQTMTVHLWRSS